MLPRLQGEHYSIAQYCGLLPFHAELLALTSSRAAILSLSELAFLRCFRASATAITHCCSVDSSIIYAPGVSLAARFSLESVVYRLTPYTYIITSLERTRDNQKRGSPSN